MAWVQKSGLYIIKQNPGPAFACFFKALGELFNQGPNSLKGQWTVNKSFILKFEE